MNIFQLIKHEQKTRERLNRCVNSKLKERLSAELKSASKTIENYTYRLNNTMSLESEFQLEIQLRNTNFIGSFDRT